jgi:hypothetical protein
MADARIGCDTIQQARPNTIQTDLSSPSGKSVFASAQPERSSCPRITSMLALGLYWLYFTFLSQHADSSGLVATMTPQSSRLEVTSGALE